MKTTDVKDSYVSHFGWRDSLREDCIYLLTISLLVHYRYCDPSHAFPPQDSVIRWAVEMAEDFVHSNPNGMIAVGSYTIGKERVFKGRLGLETG